MASLNHPQLDAYNKVKIRMMNSEGEFVRNDSGDIEYKKIKAEDGQDVMDAEGKPCYEYDQSLAGLLADRYRYIEACERWVQKNKSTIDNLKNEVLALKLKRRQAVAEDFLLTEEETKIYEELKKLREEENGRFTKAQAKSFDYINELIKNKQVYEELKKLREENCPFTEEQAKSFDYLNNFVIEKKENELAKYVAVKAGLPVGNEVRWIISDLMKLNTEEQDTKSKDAVAKRLIKKLEQIISETNGKLTKNHNYLLCLAGDIYANLYSQVDPDNESKLQKRLRLAIWKTAKLCTMPTYEDSIKLRADGKNEYYVATTQVIYKVKDNVPYRLSPKESKKMKKFFEGQVAKQVSVLKKSYRESTADMLLKDCRGREKKKLDFARHDQPVVQLVASLQYFSSKKGLVKDKKAREDVRDIYEELKYNRLFKPEDAASVLRMVRKGKIKFISAKDPKVLDLQIMEDLILKSNDLGEFKKILKKFPELFKRDTLGKESLVRILLKLIQNDNTKVESLKALFKNDKLIKDILFADRGESRCYFVHIMLKLAEEYREFNSPEEYGKKMEVFFDLFIERIEKAGYLSDNKLNDKNRTPALQEAIALVRNVLKWKNDKRIADWLEAAGGMKQEKYKGKYIEIYGDYIRLLSWLENMDGNYQKQMQSSTSSMQAALSTSASADSMASAGNSATTREDVASQMSTSYGSTTSVESIHGQEAVERKNKAVVTELAIAPVREKIVTAGDQSQVTNALVKVGVFNAPVSALQTVSEAPQRTA